MADLQQKTSSSNIRLSLNELEQSNLVFYEFFLSYDLDTIRDNMEWMIEMMIEAEGTQGRERGELYTMCRNVMKLIEAAYLHNLGRQEKTNV